MISVLLFMDDSNLAKTILNQFEQHNIMCDYAQSYKTVLHLLQENHYQTLIIDLNDSHTCIFDACEKLREAGFDIPIILLNQPKMSKEVITAFHAGADDYLEKPIFIEELLVRTLSLSRRGSGQNKFLSVGNLTLNLSKRQVTCGDQQIHMSPTKFKLLEALMRSSPNPVSRQHLIQRVWGENQPEHSSSLRVHIFLLRKLLTNNCAYQFIHTVPGYGFFLNQESDNSKALS